MSRETSLSDSRCLFLQSMLQSKFLINDFRPRYLYHRTRIGIIGVQFMTALTPQCDTAEVIQWFQVVLN